MKNMWRHLSNILLIALFSISAVYAADREADLNTHSGINGPQQNEDNKPPGDGDPDGCNKKGSPVYLKDRTFVWNKTDVVLKGRPALALTRSYNSYDSREGIFGKGWTATCERSLIKVLGLKSQLLENSVAGANTGSTAEASAGDQKLLTTTINVAQVQYIYRAASGRRYSFSQDVNGVFQSPPGFPNVVLTETTTGAKLVAIDGSHQEYNQLGQLFSDVDRHGNRINYRYEEGALTKIEDTNGRFLQLAYDSTGHVTSVQDHTGREWQYTYNSDGTLASIIDPLNGEKTFEYQNFVPAGSGETYALLTKITDQTGVAIINVEYDAKGKVSTYSEGEDIYRYTDRLASNGYIEKTDRQNAKWTYYLDELGQKTQVKDPLGNSQYFEYDDSGYITKITNADGTEFTSTYDAQGRLLTNTTPAGILSLEFEGAKSWPKTINSVSGRKIQFTYDDKGNVLTIIDPSEAVTKFEWSTQGDLLSTTDALGNISKQTINEFGLVLIATNALSHNVQFEYDARNNVSKIFNALGNSTSLAYDGLDRITKQTNSLGYEISFTYDASSRLLSVTAPNGKSVSYEYDSFGRRSKRIDYDGKEETYQYQFDNLLSSYGDKAGVTTSYTYDSNKRLTKIDVGGETTQFQYDKLGQRTQASNTTGTVTFKYDALGHMTEETNNGNTINYTYNNEGEKTSYAAFGNTYDYSYDNRGLLTKITAPHGDYSLQYDSLGRRTQLMYPNASKTDYSYNAVNQLNSQLHSGVFNANYQYSYDAAGQMNSFAGDGDPKNYEYDSIGRLLRAADSFGDVSYSYDVMDNHTNNGQMYDDLNHLLEDNNNTYTYDAKGNLTLNKNKTTGARTIYTWSKQGQLVKLEQFSDGEVTTAESVTTFKYGPLGRRWLRVKDGATEKFVYSGQDRIATFDNTNSKIEELIFGTTIDEPIGLSKDGVDYNYFSNYLGSITAITDDSSIVNSYQYGAFGKTNTVAENISNTHQYTGRERETDELYYYRARYYDPTAKRFISEDPLGFSSGDINFYTYVANTPVNAIDPLGLRLWYADTASDTSLRPHIKEMMKTPKGRELLKLLHDDARTFYIHSGFDDKGDSNYQQGNHVYIDPNTNVYIATDDPCKRRLASTTRILAHELGHLTGTKDDGPNNMNNVNKWENPIMFPLSGFNRTKY